MKKRILSAFIVMIIAVTMGESTYQWNRNKGQIYLYGEAHAESELIEREYDLWYKYYHEDGMRHLFIEAPYYDAEFLNLWMQSGSDELLEQMRIEQIGPSGASSVSNEFYKKIKRECPKLFFMGQMWDISMIQPESVILIIWKKQDRRIQKNINERWK